MNKEQNKKDKKEKTLEETLKETDTGMKITFEEGEKIPYIRFDKERKKFYLNMLDESGYETSEELGETFEGVIVSMKRSLVQFPPFNENRDPNEKVRPLVKTTGVFDNRDAAKNIVTNEINFYKRLKVLYPEAKTEYTLSILINNPKSEKEGEDNYTKARVVIKGYSLSPNNDKNLFSFMRDAREKNDHVSYTNTGFGFGESEFNGNTFYFTTLTAKEKINDDKTLKDLMQKWITEIHETYTKIQNHYMNEADKTAIADAAKGVKKNPGIDYPKSTINPNDIPF